MFKIKRFLCTCWSFPLCSSQWQQSKTLLLLILYTKIICLKKKNVLHSLSSTCGGNMSPCGQILLSKQWFLVSTYLFWPKPYLKTLIAIFLFDQKFCLLKTFNFLKELRFFRVGFLAILKYVKTHKTVKKGQTKFDRLESNLKFINFRLFWL